MPTLIGCSLSKKRKKLITVEHQPYHLTSFFGWIWLAFSLLFSDKIVFLNEASEQAAKKKTNLFFYKKKVQIIPNGIDLKLFKPLAEPVNSELIIGMQSRLVKTKDHETLLKAFALLKQQEIILNKPLKLKLAGDGENRKYLENLANTLNITDDINFIGMLTEAELIPFMQSLHIYVHASSGETMSTAIMQAMACKKAIIASDVPGINSMVRDNYSGLLVTVKNEHKLAEAIKLLIKNTELTKTLSENAWDFAQKNYSNTLMFQRYKNLLSDF